MLRGQLATRWENRLVVLATGLFAAGLCFIPPTLFESMDYVRFYEANFEFLADAVHEGRFPLWNPYIGLGRPYLADMQNAVFYPPLYLICLGQEAGLFLLVWLHCLLAVFGMRVLAGRLRAGRWQSYFMALSYLASGALTARWMTGQILYCCALCYVPGLFGCALRTEEPWQSRRVALYGLLLGGQFLCGHPQVFWFSGIGQAAFVVGRSLRLPWQAAARDAGRGFCQLGAACLWCLGLIVVVLLPFLELIQQGNRVVTSPAFANFFKLEWEHLGSLISPHLLTKSGHWINWEMNLFVGPIVLLLGLAGLCLGRDRNVRGLLAVLVVALLIALGDNTPFFQLFYRWLPGFAGFRCHARAAALVVLVLSCTAGIWLSRPHLRLRHLLPGIGIGLICLQGLGLLWGTWFIKRIYNYSAVYGTSPTHPVQTTLVAQLREQGLLQPFREPPRVCAPPLVVPANCAMVYRYSTFDAYTSLFLRRPWDYLHAMLGIHPPELANNRVADEVYQHGPFPYADIGLVAGIDPAGGALYLEPDPVPRAFVVYAAETVGDYDTILTRLAKGHQIRHSALLEMAPPWPLPRDAALPGTVATIRHFEPNELLIDVQATQDALVVLAEAWYPGWRAEIDGRAFACLPANLWMRAVPVPAGRHQVRVYFHQDYLLPGLLISLASISVLLLTLAWRQLRSR